MRMRACSVCLLLGACGLPDGEYFGKVEDRPDPTHITYCNSGEPEYLDPALSTSTTETKPVYAMFDGLTEYGLDGRPELSAATSWEASADQRRFTFHLRPDARWSDGHPLTAGDFVYSYMRVLHPATGSRRSDSLWKLKNGELYTASRVKVALRDAPPFKAGDIVEVVGLDGKVADKPDELALPDSNLRASSRPLRLRDQGAVERDAYATVPPGREVTIVELSPDRGWAYVFFDQDDGVYGWVPAQELDREPNAAARYTVRRIRSEQVPGLSLPPDPPDAPRPTAVVAGRDLLMLPEVLGVRAVDPHTLVLETWGPLPYMLDLTPQGPWRATPRWVVSRWPKRWSRPEHIVTSGAFHLTEWKIRDHFELVKSPTFWDAAHVRIQRFTVFSLDDQAANTNLYIQGSCDAVAANNIPASYLPFLTAQDAAGRRKYADFSLSPFLGIYYYHVNAQRFPNVHFRRALALAVDRRPLPSITRGGEYPTTQYMPGTPVPQLTPAERALCGVAPDTPGVGVVVGQGDLCYRPPRGLAFDPAKAHAELELARREMGARFPRKFTVRFNAGAEGHKLIAEWLQQEWQRNLGLTVELEVQEWKTFLKSTAAGDYDVARFGGIGNFPEPEEFLPTFKCASPDNRSKWCNKEFDALLARAEATADRKQRLALDYKAEETLLEDAPLIPLYVYTQKQLQKPYVRDLAINWVDQQPWRRVWIDASWRERAAVARQAPR